MLIINFIAFEIVSFWGNISNGSGKTTLAMASLWALTGSMDPRPTQDSKVSDVIHDRSKVYLKRLFNLQILE